MLLQLSMSPEPEKSSSELISKYKILKKAEDFIAFSQENQLLPLEVYADSLDRATQVLEKQSGIEKISNDSPTIVVSDLHGRRELISNLLKRNIIIDYPATIFEQLEKKRINLVFLGDGVHTENESDWNPFVLKNDQNESVLLSLEESAAWLMLNRAFSKGLIPNTDFQVLQDPKYKNILLEVFENLKQSNDPDVVKILKDRDELTEKNTKIISQLQVLKSIGTMKMVQDLISLFPENVKFIRGNHDDIDSSLGISTSKGTSGINQSETLQEWVIKYLGEDYAIKYAAFEELLPLVVHNDVCAFSHAIPKQELEINDINDRTKEATLSLTWTENRPGVENTLSEDKMYETLKAMFSKLKMYPQSLWFIGHRTVGNIGKYREQCQGHLIQICDDEKQLVAHIPRHPLNGRFTPEHQVIDLLDSRK